VLIIKKIKIMKKIILSIFAVLAFGVANAQFKVGVNGGIPVGDIGDSASFTLGADVAYTWELSEGFEAGVTSGYTHFFLKDAIDADDPGFIPVAATAQYSFTENFFVGGDIGYGIPTNDGQDGGLLYQPKIGYKINKVEIYAGYKGISVTGGEWSSVNLGVNFKL